MCTRHLLTCVCSRVQWMVLHPNKYNKHVQYAWRFHPCEVKDGKLVAADAAQRKAPLREPLVDDCETDEEFYE